MMYLKINSAPSSDYKYQSIENSYKANGDRHMSRAKMHMADGKIEYAIGSLKKAKRNYDIYMRIMNLKILYPIELKRKIDRMAEQVANNIMNGTI